MGALRFLVDISFHCRRTRPYRESPQEDFIPRRRLPNCRERARSMPKGSCPARLRCLRVLSQYDPAKPVPHPYSMSLASASHRRRHSSIDNINRHEEGNVCYGGELGVPGTTPSNLVRHLQTPLSSQPNGVTWRLQYIAGSLVSRTYPNAESALKTHVAARAVLCVNYTARTDHLVFPTHSLAFQRPIQD